MIPADALWLAYIRKPIKITNTNIKSKEKVKGTKDIPTAITRWKGKFFHESLAQKMKTY